MSGDTLYDRPRKHNVAKMRVHDYLYDSAYIVSGARDYARTAFKAAMASAQVILQPVYNSMFSDMRLRPRMQVVYHPNCRLPDHIDRSYGAYVNRIKDTRSLPGPELRGKDRYKFNARPRKVMAMPATTPDFHPATPMIPTIPTKPRNRGTQSIYRETSAQTLPWQPDGKAHKDCETTPEVMHLGKLEWGSGKPFRMGDLPADFHTTEIINKMRHGRAWAQLVERGMFQRWMKKQDDIVNDIECNDWIFREAEIDELQVIRLELLHRLQLEQRQKRTNRTSTKLAKLWDQKKQEMQRKYDQIRKTRDRELRKLVALHEGGGRAGLVARMRHARGAGSMVAACRDPTSDLHAPLARHGYQARRRHAPIVYDPALLSLEDHKELGEPPAWLEAGVDLTKSYSGHHLPRDPNTLCERQTKWSEQFLENLHNDLKKARLGAAKMTAGPLHVLKSRKETVVERPSTPEVESVDDMEETSHQAALVLQKIIRGRAVQNLMYEGRTRAAELTEELKTTHGLQKDDKIRICKEESKAREFNARRTEIEQKDDAITALVDELCGGAVSAALDFLEKELRRLKEERRQHAFLLIAIREKTMREAAEAGRRQKEEHRRREHDEMFKQILGVTQGTVDAYLREVIEEGVELAAEEDAMIRARSEAEKYNNTMIENEDLSTSDTNELVAELVQQFLLPHTHKEATRHHIQKLQEAKLEAARATIFGLIDGAMIRKDTCVRCGAELDDKTIGCICRNCPINLEPKETTSRDDWRWKYARRRPKDPPKPRDERYPLAHDVRCMLSDLLVDVVARSRKERAEAVELKLMVKNLVEQRIEITLDAKHMLNVAVDVAMRAISPPLPRRPFHYTMKRIHPDVFEKTKTIPTKYPCPKDLPSEIRRRAEEIAARGAPVDITCRCEEPPEEPVPQRPRIKFGSPTSPKRSMLLPSEIRNLEEMKRCKCDPGLPPRHPSPDLEFEPPSTSEYSEVTDDTTTMTEEGKDIEEEPDTTAEEEPE